VKCTEFLDELTNYLDGVIDARTKSELEDHLAWCHNCYVVRHHTQNHRDLPQPGTLRVARRSSRPVTDRHHEQVHQAQKVRPPGDLKTALPPFPTASLHYFPTSKP